MTTVPSLSPLEALPNLERHLGLPVGRLMMLREDLIGVHGGGNKVRKAAVALGRAKAEGVRTVVTTGAPQSNHARAVASLAAHHGLDCVLVLEGDEPPVRTGNLLLEGLAGAEIVWSRSAPPDQAAADIAEAREASRIIPFGGSDPAAVEVYAQVGDELLKRVPDLSMVVVAVGSGATAAGLIAALGASHVLAVDTGAVSDSTAVLTSLLKRARPDQQWEPADLRVDGSQVGSGYEHAQSQVVEAVRTVLRTDGVLFDVTYAGRALSALMTQAESRLLPSEGRIVLVHTGGIPGLFGHSELIAW